MAETDKPRDVRDAAHGWRVVMDDNPSAQERSAFAQWIDADVRHRAAYRRAATIWAAMGEVNAERQRQRKRRRWSLAGGAAAAAMAAGFAAYTLIFPEPAAPDAVPQALYVATAPGEIRRISLDDQSELTLGGGAQIRVIFSVGERRAVLSSGDAYFDIARDETRPFVISAGAVEVSVLGTAFAIGHSPAGTTVQVANGRVAVAALGKGDGAAPRTTLTAGESIAASPAGKLADRQAVDARDVAAWRSGRLVFDAVTLREVVATLDRYSPRPISLIDVGRREQTISATLKVEDIDSSLAMIAAIFDVEIATSDDAIIVQEKTRVPNS